MHRYPKSRCDLAGLPGLTYARITSPTVYYLYVIGVIFTIGFTYIDKHFRINININISINRFLGR